MPITITTNQLKFKDPTTGQYRAISAVADESLEDRLAEISAAGAEAIADVTSTKNAALQAVEAKEASAVANVADAAEVQDMVAEVFDVTKNYNAGDYVIYETSGVSKLYRFTANHAAGAWVGTDVVLTTVGEDLGKLTSEGGIEPVIVNMFDYFFAAGQDSLSNLVTDNITVDSKYLVVNGTQGSTVLEVDETSVLEISDLMATPCSGILEFPNGDLELVSIYVNSGVLTVYPALSQDAVKAKIYSEGYSVHLSTAGYKYYANCLTSQNVKYARKRKAIAQYNPFVSGETNPLTKIGTYWWGADTRNVRDISQRVKVNGTTKFLNCSFATGATVENPKGFEWEVNLSGKTGYVEMYVGALSGTATDGDFSEGLDFIIEFYQDGNLTDTYIKHSKKFEPVRFDFSNAQAGKIKLYTTGGASKHQANVTQITWWETDETGEYIFKPYAVPCLLMDSWGVYHDNAFVSQLQSNLSAQMNGMSANVINHSLGSQTSEWGVNNFYVKAFAEHPNYLISDFQINDINLGVTEAAFIANMKNIIRASLATGIVPVIILQAHTTRSGDYSRYTFPFIKAITN